MKILSSIYVFAGRAVYIASLPLLRIYLRPTTRCYLLSINSDNEVLVVKNWLGNGKWALPGGGINKSESPETALYRELVEELKVEIDTSVLNLVSKGVWLTDKLGFKYSIYSSTELITSTHLNKMELVDTKRINIKNLGQHNISNEILNSIKTLIK